MKPIHLKIKLRAVTAGVLLAAAGASQAAIQNSTGDGELYLTLIKSSGSATFDLSNPTVVSGPAGLGSIDPSISSFDPAAVAALGITLTWDVSGTTAWQSFIAAAPGASGTFFDVKGASLGDGFSTGYTAYTTSPTNPTTVANTSPVQLGGFASVDDFVNATNAVATHNVPGNGSNFALPNQTSLYHQTAVGNAWKNNFTGITYATVGTSVPFYSLSAFLLDDAIVSTPFAGTFSLSNAGVLTYETAPIPEPSTYAMLAVGLAGLGFAARRRTR